MIDYVALEFGELGENILKLNKCFGQKTMEKELGLSHSKS